MVEGNKIPKSHDFCIEGYVNGGGSVAKRLGIVTSSRDVGIEYKRQLTNIFGDKVEILTYSFEAGNIKSFDNLDAILISTYSQYEVLNKLIDKNVRIIISKLTLSKKGFEMLKNSNINKPAMLVNLSFEMCIETMALLYQLGFDYLELVSVYPNMNKIPDLDMAITTGESRYVPKDVKNVLDLGHRLIDKDTIVEIAASLHLEEILSEKRVSDYFNTLVSYNKGVEFLISKSNILRNQFNTLLSLMEKGVIGVDKDCTIESCNGIASNIIGSSCSYVGLNASEVLPQIEFKKFLSNGKPIKNKLIEINGKHITLSIFPIAGLNSSENINTANGAFAIIESFESKENSQNLLRLQLANKGHVAKYTVDDIAGKSKEIETVKKLIIRMANSKSPVLITGESGTGKELAAQAIHNASPLKDRHFVAINCAAISPQLLESELFGYERGAFTGASKEGKMGIFELANNGTLFLDEIGEIPKELQTRFLRVLQEKEVMRVGGDKNIKINVRIIAATNRNMHEQVESGLFRKDLYYRLNILPINLPPLRDRTEDIEILIETLKKQNGYRFKISGEVMDFFEGYSWNGNVRELINCMEYLDNLGIETVELKDLPYYMKVHSKIQPSNLIIKGLDERQTFVLRLFYEAFKNKVKLGRRSISRKAFENELHLSEYDVRAILHQLKALGYINLGLGRGGSTITPKGIDLFKEL
ncbi:MAG: sigma 54-interacting transcriptional regulator [Sedimentibacter sp.]|nr:sigma 54-interacting transcriptional regulator [Sedimentibacter sp.]